MVVVTAVVARSSETCALTEIVKVVARSILLRVHRVAVVAVVQLLFFET